MVGRAHACHEKLPGRARRAGLGAVASLATIVAATSIAGCALLFVSTEGLTGGPTDDAATSTVDGQGSDAGGAGESGPIDGSVIDANLDAATGDADASLPFCASHPGHTF